MLGCGLVADTRNEKEHCILNITTSLTMALRSEHKASLRLEWVLAWASSMILWMSALSWAMAVAEPEAQVSATMVVAWWAC